MIFFEVVILIICDYFPKLLKIHFFILQIFRSHFGSFFCAYNTYDTYESIIFEISTCKDNAI